MIAGSPSLLPYLHSHDSRISLRISPASQNAAVLERIPFPFAVVSGANPFARLIEAEFVTDTGSKINRVFMLVQRDRCHSPREGLWPLTNSDVDQFWQNAFAHYCSAQNRNNPALTLAEQVDVDGKLASLQALFHCRARQTYFHPPCPKCGLTLQLCRDDRTLAEAGLSPYSTSLKRYLFCPACLHGGHHHAFYTDEIDSLDPLSVKNRTELIKEFGLLLDSQAAASELPCVACPEKQECYGVEYAATANIVPFAFFPFHMLVFEAPSIMALDFLPLLSGASFDDLKAHLEVSGDPSRSWALDTFRRDRQDRLPFIFAGDDRTFAEVLYLKLSFLAQLLEVLSSSMGAYGRPDLPLSIDPIWVRLADPGKLLPYFWNFKLELIDVGRHAFAPVSGPPLPLSHTLYFLGLTWFTALTANKRQTIATVYGILRQAMQQQEVQPQTPLELSLLAAFPDTFSPENIFWDPGERTVHERWHGLWLRSLNLGCALVRNSLDSDAVRWSPEAFQQELEDLRTEVKASLFQEKLSSGETSELATSPTSSEDTIIPQILRQIAVKWQAAGQTWMWS